MKTLKDHKTPSCPCPACHTVMNGAAGVTTDESPSPGDITICIECGSILKFGPDFQLELTTDDEVAGLDKDLREAVREAQTMILNMNATERGIKKQ